ncbi:MAG: ATP-binding cassette domain-containing protein, partial [Atopobium minutum]|nr:ATP-binding cassette domain-containing protein [Atopobium minutum]
DPVFLMVDLIMLLFLSGIISVCCMRIMYASQYIFEATYALDTLEKLYAEMFEDKLSFGTETAFSSYDIAFDQVSFSYGEKSVFSDLSFSLEQGKTYALVGSSGSGKSTIAKLLSGFYKVDSGAIKIGGKSIESYTEETMTEAVSFVFQDPKLFKLSIYDNVALAKKHATHDEVMQALYLAGCDDILDKFPERERTLIGSKGVYLSGGEKQRIAIARAMLKNSPIVVMDEASAAIDADNEYKLQQSFKNLMKDKTVIMIAHRLSSIQDVDEIIVLEQGALVERGSHAELMAQDSTYKQLVELYNTTNDWRL